MKSVKLELSEIMADINTDLRRFVVERATNTTEWKIGSVLSLKEVDAINERTGKGEVTVTIRAKGGR